MMKTCAHCGKTRERSRDEDVCPDCKHPATRAVNQPVESPITRECSLFALGDRRELVCVLCARVIPHGPDQAYERAYHGQAHVRDGSAVEDRRGLPEGAVRYLVKAKVTA